MKKALAIICSLFLFCVTGYAAESFDSGWSEYTEGGGTGSFTPGGTTLNFSAASTSGNYFWGTYSQSSGNAFGASATFNISSSNSSGGASATCGIRKYIAYTTTGTRILAEIWLDDYDGSKSLRYRVREREANTSTNIQRLAQGAFGEWEGSWSTGEDITLSMALRDNIIYFQCSKFSNEIFKVELNNLASEIDGVPVLFVSLDGAASMQGASEGFTLSSKLFYLPHVSSNATWTDYIQADNNSGSNASFTLTLYDDSGNQVYSGTHDVLANSEAVILPKTLSSAARLGKITCTNHLVFFRYSYENENGGVAEFKVTDEAYGSAGFYFNSTASMVDWKGLAITNFGASSDNITLYAYGNGSLLGTATDTVPANGKLSGVHTKWFPNVELTILDRIIVVSSGENKIGGIVICGNSTNENLLFTGAASAIGFVPPQ